MIRCAMCDNRQPDGIPVTGPCYFCGKSELRYSASESEIESNDIGLAVPVEPETWPSIKVPDEGAWCDGRSAMWEKWESKLKLQQNRKSWLSEYIVACVEEQVRKDCDKMRTAVNGLFACIEQQNERSGD